MLSGKLDMPQGSPQTINLQSLPANALQFGRPILLPLPLSRSGKKRARPTAATRDASGTNRRG